MFWVFLSFVLTSSLFGLTSSTAVTLSDTTSVNNGVPSVAVGSNGDGVAVWTNIDNSIFAAVYTASTNTWATAATLATGLAPKVAVDGSGNAFLVYIASDRNVYYRRYTASNQTWETAQLLSSTSAENILPAISMNSSGVALVVWVSTSPFGVYASTFDPTTELFSTPETFLSNNSPSSFQIDDQNTGIAVWQTFPQGQNTAAILTVP